MILPLVSVLVPVYGVEEYIERCARSLMEQTYEHCEFVFVDDCSPDNSVEILQSIIDKYPKHKNQVKIIHHKNNKGLGGARLTGIRNSAGNFITFVDSDDWVESDYVERLVSVAIAYDADYVTSLESECQGDVYQITQIQLIRRLLMRRESPHIWGNLVRRNIMERYDIMPIEGIDMAEDFHFTTRYLSECHRVFSIGRQIYHYMPDNPESYTKRYTEKSVESILRSVDTVYQYLLKKDTNNRNILNIMALEFYKGMRMKGSKVATPDLLVLFSDYVHRLQLNLVERAYLKALDSWPLSVVKVFSTYYYNKYCK